MNCYFPHPYLATRYILITCGSFVGLILLMILGMYCYGAHKAAEQVRLQAELQLKRKTAQGALNVNFDGSMPEGMVVLVDTDVESSTALWEWDANLMAEALLLHDTAQRDALKKCGGRELLTEGDAFLSVFTDPCKAVNYCIELQEALMQAKWPEELAASGNNSTETVDGVFNGLKVRMGAHYGQMDVHSISQLDRSDVMRITCEVSGFAHGGQILVSNDLFAVVQDTLDVERIDMAPVGSISDVNTTISQTTCCVQLTPRSLDKRVTEFLPVYETMSTRPPAGQVTAVFTYCKDNSMVIMIPPPPPPVVLILQTLLPAGEVCRPHSCRGRDREDDKMHRRSHRSALGICLQGAGGQVPHRLPNPHCSRHFRRRPSRCTPLRFLEPRSRLRQPHVCSTKGLRRCPHECGPPRLHRDLHWHPEHVRPQQDHPHHGLLRPRHQPHREDHVRRPPRGDSPLRQDQDRAREENAARL
jgi:class 3 adenylate cyclase